MASGESEQDLLKDIAEQIAKNQMSFDSKSEEEKRKLLGKLDIIAASQLNELQKEFNALIGGIEGEIPENARIIILQGISDRVSSERIKSLDNIFSSKDVQVLASTIVTEIVSKNTDKEIVEDKADILILGKNLEIDKDEIQEKLLNDLSEKYDGKYTLPEEMKMQEEDIANIVSELDETELAKTIDKANGGDKNSRIVITALMSAMPFAKTTVKFEELSGSDKEIALRSLDTLALAYAEIGDSNLFVAAQKLSEKWGVEIITYDENGKPTIDREKIKEFAKQNNINYSTAKKEDFELYDKAYKNLDGVDDFTIETQITATQYSLNRNIDIFTQEIRSGRKLEELQPQIDLMFEENFDATLMVLKDLGEGWKDDTEISPAERNMRFYMFNKAALLYEGAQKGENDGVIDNFTDGYMQGIIDSSIDFMIKSGFENKELIDNMLRVAPNEVQKKMKDSKFSQYDLKPSTECEPIKQEQEQDDPLMKKIKNLLKTLNNRIDNRGIDNTLDYVSTMITSTSDLPTKKDYMNVMFNILENRENSYNPKEMAARKGFFSAIIAERIYDEQALKKMVEIDSTSTKGILDDMIERQNTLSENNIDAIMDIGKQMKEAKDTKVLESGKVSVTDVVEHIVANEETEKTFENSDRDDDDAR